MYRVFLRNPITIWMYYLSKSIHYQFRYRHKNLSIGNMSHISKCKFGYYNRIYEFVKLKNVKLGDYSYISSNTQIKNADIGKFCSIGPNCTIGLGQHPTKNFVSSHPIFFSTNKQIDITYSDKNYFKEEENIILENDIWVGANVIILDGVTVSNGAIIAAGSVVTKDVPPYAIVGGIPAKIIKFRFPEETINILQDISWWNKDESFLKNNFKKFHDINLFLNMIKNN